MANLKMKALCLTLKGIQEIHIILPTRIVNQCFQVTNIITKLIAYLIRNSLLKVKFLLKELKSLDLQLEAQELNKIKVP